MAVEIVKKLQGRGFQAYFAGGCVRDLVMRRTPQDYDIATEATPAEVSRLFTRTIPVGRRFGIVLVVENRIPFEVATFRGEKSKEFSPRPEADVKKRDFTINGLLYDPVRRKVFDYLGGRKDIEKKIIRFIGDPEERIREDSLRLIRAVRLAVGLGFTIEKRSYQAIRRMSVRIRRVSKERIRDELAGILTAPDPYRGFRLLDDTGLLSVILPEVERMKGVMQPEEFHPEGDVFTHTLLMLKGLKKSSLVLALGVLLHDVGKPQTFAVRERIRFNGHDRIGAELAKKIMKRLRFPNTEITKVAACIENHIRILNAPRMREATLQRLFLRETFVDELELHRLDCLASHRDLKVWRFLKKKFIDFKKKPAEEKPLLSGNDLLRMGFAEGPVIGRIHRELLDLQLEGKLRTRAEARQWVRKHREMLEG